MMNLAIFATGHVGAEVIDIVRGSNECLSCVVLDSAASKESNNEIIRRINSDKLPCILYSDSLYSEQTLSALSAFDLDIVILAWWPYIIRRHVLEIPRIGCLNFHPSLLPYNRGRHYNFWTIVEGSPFGVSIHWVDEGVDTGAIAFQRRIEKSWEDTGATLYQKAQVAMVELFRDTFDEICRGAIPRTPQNLTKGSFHRNAELVSASHIELERLYTARSLLNLLRARTFKPHPGAWFEDDGIRYEARIEIVRYPTSERD